MPDVKKAQESQPEQQKQQEQDKPQGAAEEQEQKVEAEENVSDATDQVQEVVDKETEQGFRGTEVDQTPNEAYTVQGVLRGDFVPEAAADKTAAIREATNPDVGAR